MESVVVDGLANLTEVRLSPELSRTPQYSPELPVAALTALLLLLTEFLISVHCESQSVEVLSSL